MKCQKLKLLLAITLLFPKGLIAQETKTDSTTVNSKEVKNRNVLLNAASADKPREIPIGLPASLAATIFEDGVPVSYNTWPDMPYYSWFGGISYENITVLNLSETALQLGTVGYTVDSYTRKSSENFQGLINYSVNTYGRQTFDAAISGQIGKGWGYMVSSNQIWDPGTSIIQAANLQNRSQVYKFNIDKTFADNRGFASLLYQHSSYQSNASSYAPFIFVGDGSVKEYNGFSMGTDAYFPNQGSSFTYMDIKTGEIKSTTWKDAGTTINNQLTFKLDYTFNNGNRLKVSSKYKDGNVNMALFEMSGITENTGSYYYQDGSPFTGENIQNRWLMHVPGYERSWLTTAILSGTTANNKHNWRIGANAWWNRSEVAQQNVVMAHEVKNNPEMLYVKDDKGLLTSALSYNPGSGEYYKGQETKFALFLSDDWDITKKLWMSAGVRGELLSYNGQGAFNITDDDTYNDRTMGWNLNNGTARLTDFSDTYFNLSATYNIRYNLFKGFGFVGEYVYTQSKNQLEDYAGSYNTPQTDKSINMARAGIFFNRPWLQLVSQVSFISQSNNRNRTTFYHVMESDGGGYKKGEEASATIPLLYGIQTIGWTTDVIFTPFPGFSLHGLLTLQNPIYKDFNISATYPDGVTDGVDLSNKTVTAMSKCLIELNPSYTYKKWNAWLSFRYSSKQYINKTNSLYFNGWWESFGGVKYNLNKKVDFGVNVVNLFNQSGATGSIGAADLVTDASMYKNYLMSGSYIRPFEVSLTTTIKF